MKNTSKVLHMYGLLIFLLFNLMIPGCTPSLRPKPTIEPTARPTDTPKEVVLKIGSWRTDDVEEMNRLWAIFHEQHPHIIIEYDPTPATQYDAALEAQLEEGIAPDLFYLRSYGVSRHLYEKGYLAPLGDVLDLENSFAPAMLAPWTTEEGNPYGVPFIATSHGIYYNKDIFEELNLPIPATWEEFLTTAQTIQDAEITPFANTSGSQWTIAEIVFMNLAPNFIGGREGRMAYLSGERCFNDPHMVAAFEAVEDLAPHLPENQDLLDYADSLQIFMQGKAAMWLGGSWDIPYFESQDPNFAWSVFAPPPPAGQPAYITFHLDAGMGLNANSQHKEEALEVLAWMTSPEFGALLGNELPGFFPMHKQAPQLKNEHANTFLTLNQDRGTDVRFAWEKLRTGSPDGYTLILEGAIAVLNGEQTPQEAADALQSGLEQWFVPAQECGQ